MMYFGNFSGIWSIVKYHLCFRVELVGSSMKNQTIISNLNVCIMKLEFCSLGCAMMIIQVDLVKAIRLANHKLCTSVAPCRKDLLNVFLLCRFLISAACFLWLCWPVCCFCVCWQFTGDRVIAKRCWNYHVFGSFGRIAC